MVAIWTLFLQLLRLFEEVFFRPLPPIFWHWSFDSEEAEAEDNDKDNDKVKYRMTVRANTDVSSKYLALPLSRPIADGEERTRYETCCADHYAELARKHKQTQDKVFFHIAQLTDKLDTHNQSYNRLSTVDRTNFDAYDKVRWKEDMEELQHNIRAVNQEIAELHKQIKELEVEETKTKAHELAMRDLYRDRYGRLNTVYTKRGNVWMRYDFGSNTFEYCTDVATVLNNQLEEVSRQYAVQTNSRELMSPDGEAFLRLYEAPPTFDSIKNVVIKETKMNRFRRMGKVSDIQWLQTIPTTKVNNRASISFMDWQQHVH